MYFIFLFSFFLSLFEKERSVRLEPHKKNFIRLMIVCRLSREHNERKCCRRFFEGKYEVAARENPVLHNAQQTALVGFCLRSRSVRESVHFCGAGACLRFALYSCKLRTYKERTFTR